MKNKVLSSIRNIQRRCLPQFRSNSVPGTFRRQCAIAHPHRWPFLLFMGSLLSAMAVPVAARSTLMAPDSMGQPHRTIAQSAPAGDRFTTTATQVLERINQLRTSQGLSPLRINAQLNQVAQSYTQVLADRNCWGHRCDGRSPTARTRAAGMGAHITVENLFRVPVDALNTQDLGELILDTWVTNLSHRCHLLRPDLSEMGLGILQQDGKVYATFKAFQSADDPFPVSAAMMRADFERRLQQAPPELAVQLVETAQTHAFGEQLGTPLCGITSSAQQTAATLNRFTQLTAQRTAVLYVVALQDQLHLLLVPPQFPVSARRSSSLIAATTLPQLKLAQAPSESVVRQVRSDIGREQLMTTVKAFRKEVSDPSKYLTQSYLASAQQLYQWLVAPLEAELQANQIDTILFSMDDGLRSIPVAALHDGQQFLVEKHGVALIPSFGLTQARQVDHPSLSMLAMGISEGIQGQASLPGVETELSILTEHLWQDQTQVTLNHRSTLANLRLMHRQYQPGIIHLATHAEFQPGRLRNSFIQFWDHQLTLNQLQPLSQELKWGSTPSVELLVLSACQTALDSQEAELGFAGSAIAAGVPSTLASLWSVSDDGTLGMMTKFYQRLKGTTTKVEAVRQAQLSMLSGDLQIKEGQLQLVPGEHIPLPPIFAERGNRNFVHPYCLVWLHGGWAIGISRA